MAFDGGISLRLSARILYVCGSRSDTWNPWNKWYSILVLQEAGWGGSWKVQLAPAQGGSAENFFQPVRFDSCTIGWSVRRTDHKAKIHEKYLSKRIRLPTRTNGTLIDSYAAKCTFFHPANTSRSRTVARLIRLTCAQLSWGPVGTKGPIWPALTVCRTRGPAPNWALLPRGEQESNFPSKVMVWVLTRVTGKGPYDFDVKFLVGRFVFMFRT